MALLDALTGGNSSNATDAEQAALAALSNLQTPTAQQLTLPQLQQYAAAIGMSPAQMQAFLQQNNALASETTPQTGTDAQVAALSQLANTANQGAAGNATEQAQESQIQNQSNEQLAGQRGAIDQQAEARGVAPGLLQAALAQQNAGQDIQGANQSALTAQSNNYQTALQALANEGSLGQGLQGQQNTQANTVAAAQNAMQQFNAANQQSAAAANAGYQQQANATNTAAQNAVQQANTGLKNQQTLYNAQVPETVYNNQLGKATGVAQQNQNLASNYTGQGQQNAGAVGGLLGTAGTVIGGIYGGPMGAAVGSQLGSEIGGSNGPPASANSQQYAPQGPGQSLNVAHGGEIPCLCGGGMCMVHGGKVPGKAPMPGDHTANDVVPARLSPGEAVIPRSVVQQNPQQVHQLLAQSQQQPEGHNPQDVAALLQAMKHLRGQNAPR
jgi:hypothetical protein